MTTTTRVTSIENGFISYLRISRDSEVFYFVYHFQNYHKTKSETHRNFEIEIIKKLPSWLTFSRIWSFQVVVMHSDVAVAVALVAVEVCLNSLLSQQSSRAIEFDI